MSKLSPIIFFGDKNNLAKKFQDFHSCTITMSSEVFEQNEDDFNTTVADLEDKLSAINLASGEDKKRLIRQFDRSIDEARVLIDLMDEESKKSPMPFRSQQMSAIKRYNTQIEKLKRDLSQANTRTGQTAVFFSTQSNTDEFENREATQRARLMAGSEILGRASDSLARSHRIAAETDDIATNTIDELSRQGESLVRTRDRLHDTNTGLKESRKILKSMARRIITNKLVLFIIIFIEIAILGGVVYWKFFS